MPGVREELQSGQEGSGEVSVVSEVSEGECGEKLEQRGDRGRSCGALWATVRTFGFTQSDMEPQGGF